VQAMSSSPRTGNINAKCQIKSPGGNEGGSGGGGATVERELDL
jgi:hypothetical protein